MEKKIEQTTGGLKCCGEEQIIFHEEMWNSGLSEKPEKMIMADVFAPELLHPGAELMV